MHSLEPSQIRKRFPPWATTALLLITAVLGFGYIILELKFAKLGITLPGGAALYGLEIYLILLSAALLLQAIHEKRISLLEKISGLQVILIALLSVAAARALFDVRDAPLLVLRNSAFVWYLTIPLFISLLKISSRSWNRLFQVFLAIPVATVAWSLAVIWLGLEQTAFHINWAISVGIYGAFAFALSPRCSRWLSISILSIIGAGIGAEWAINHVSRTNSLGMVLVLFAHGTHIFFQSQKIILLKKLITKITILSGACLLNYLVLVSPNFLGGNITSYRNPHNPSPMVKSELRLGAVENFRYYAWKDAWELFLENPIFGIGFQQQVVYRFYAGLGTFSSNDGGHTIPKSAPISGPHNSYLNAITRLGVFGLLLPLLHALCFITLIRKKLWATAFALAGGALYAFFNVGLEGPARSAILLFALGVALRAATETPAQKFSLLGDNLNETDSNAWITNESTYHNVTAQQLGPDGSFSGSLDQDYHQYQTNFGLGTLLQESGRVLDFGCADGLSLYRFPSNMEYFGLDVSAEVLDRAKKRWPKGNLQVLRPNEALPFPDNYFHGIACLGVLHHVPRVNQTLREFERVLAPGGWIFLREPITDMCRINGSRDGLSPKERGIPPIYFKEYFTSPKWKLERIDLAGVGGLNQIRALFPHESIIAKLLLKLDCNLSKAFDPNKIIYQRREFTEKFSPTFAFYTVRKC